MSNGINSTVAMWINVLFLVLTGVAAGSVTLTGVNPDIVALAKAWAGNAAWVISIVNVVFHLFSSPTGGFGLRLLKGH